MTPKVLWNLCNIFKQMQNWNNDTVSSTDISDLIKNALLNFKAVSRQIRIKRHNSSGITNLGLYTLLCLHKSKPLLRNDIQKRLFVNYYDAGSALDSLMLNGLITNEVCSEHSNIKSIQVKRKRYRLTLNGECFLNQLLRNLT